MNKETERALIENARVRLAESEAMLAGLDALEENVAYQDLAYEINRALEDEVAQHEDPKKHPVRRAEHLWAVLRLRRLNGFVAKRREQALAMRKRALDALEP